jgi:putative FmdB family regulatory protein
MPTYEYLCQDCEQPLDVFQSFTDDALTVCPACGGVLKKVFGSVGVVFKGSGFYRTDSRDSKSAATIPAAPKTDAPKSDSAPAAPAKSDSATAAAPAAKSTSTD